MKKILGIFLALFLFTATTSFAQATNGVELLSFYKEYLSMELDENFSSFDVGCIIGGVSEVADLLDDMKFIQVPSKTSYGQMIKVVGRYLVKHPELLYEPADKLIYWALVEAYPIKQPSSKLL